MVADDDLQHTIYYWVTEFLFHIFGKYNLLLFIAPITAAVPRFICISPSFMAPPPIHPANASTAPAITGIPGESPVSSAASPVTSPIFSSHR